MAHKISTAIIDQLKTASLADQLNLYVKFRYKVKKVQQNIWFNKQCLKCKVFPKYVQIQCKTNSNSSAIAVKKAKTTWIRQEIKNGYRNLDCYFMKLKVLHSALTKSLHPVEFDTFDNDLRNRVRDFNQTKFEKQKSKLSSLTKNSCNHNNEKYTLPSNPPKFHDRIINLSNITLTTNETNLLNKGFKYNPNNTPSIKDIQDLIVDTEVAIDKIHKSDHMKHICTNIINKSLNQNRYHSANNEQKTMNILKQKLKTNQTTMVKADKGNTIVLIDSVDYKNKVLSFLNEGKFNQVKQDPTKIYQSAVRKAINNSPLISRPHTYINMNPKAPQLYGLLKIHKIGTPIRPVVSYNPAPNKLLAAKVNSLFRQHVNFNPQYTIKNSSDLINKIKNVHVPPSSKIVSFDVVNLFPSIPINDASTEIHKLIDNSKTLQAIEKQDLKHLFDICLNQNYFKFQENIFIQKEGLTMGSPLSPLVADIFMNSLETSVLTQKQFPIIYWYRYVDDIICCFNGSDRQLQNFLKHLNTLHPSIKFTIETEKDQSLNFLDLKISRIQNKLAFSIFRKPTYTDTTIHNSSFHPVSHKLAAYHSLVHRLLTIPLSPSDYKTEVTAIKTIAQNNGYSPNLINKMIHKKQKQLITNMIYPNIKDTHNKKFVSIPYIGNLSQKIAKLIKTDNTQISFHTLHNTGKTLINTKTPIPEDEKCGIYKLKCDDCNTVYIGQTGRSLKQRTTEHLRAQKTQDHSSNFADHLLECGHNFTGKATLLHQHHKSHKLNILETLEITRHNTHNTNVIICNSQIPTPSPLLNQILTLTLSNENKN